DGGDVGGRGRRRACHLDLGQAAGAGDGTAHVGVADAVVGELPREGQEPDPTGAPRPVGAGGAPRPPPACRLLDSRARRRRAPPPSPARHSTGRWPFPPSSPVEKKSARAPRTPRLSTSRVRPPVPGRTPRRGTSGRATVVVRSSAITIQSQARASS